MSILIKKFQAGKRFSVKADTIIHGGLVDKNQIPSNYQQEEPTIITLPNGKQVRRTTWSTQSNEGKPIIAPKDKVIPVVPTTQTNDPVAYANTMKGLLSSGKKTISDLVNEGKISIDAVKDYAPFEVRRDVYTDEEITPEKKIEKIINNPENQKTVVYGGVNAYRKNIVEANGNGYQAWAFANKDGNYTNEGDIKYAVGNQVIDLSKTTWDKNNKIVPHFTGEILPSETNVNYNKPSNDGVTKQNTGTVNNFIQPGTSVNRNNFGGGGVNETTVIDSKNTKIFTEPKYNSNGKLIIDTAAKPVQPVKEVGKMYNTKSLKKGGVIAKKMKKCMCGCLIYKKGKSK